jgi:hypothetical protein
MGERERRYSFILLRTPSQTGRTAHETLRLYLTSDPPRLRTGAILLLKCFSTIAYSLPREMGYLTLKEFFKSDQQFLRLARSNKQTLQLYNISINMVSY